MNKIFTLVLCFILVRCAAQNNDSQIYLGGNHIIIKKGKNAQIVEQKSKDFSNNPLAKYTYNTTAAASYDKTGKIVLASNGEKIFDSEGVIVNGDNLKGFYYGDCIMSDYPENQSKVLVLTINNEGLYKTVISASKKGKFTVSNEKNVLICKDVSNSITTCEHGNNIDKWIIVHSWRDDKFHVFLFTKNTLEEKSVFESSIIKKTNNGSIKLKLSPDGTKLVAMVRDNRIFVYDFDPQLGAIRNKSSFELAKTHDFDFSNDGAKLYVSTFDNESAVYSMAVNDGSERKNVMTLGYYVLSRLQLVGNNQMIINTPEFVGGILDLGTDKEQVVQPLIRKNVEQKYHLGLSQSPVTSTQNSGMTKSEYMPNSFSPNSDGLNDDFGVVIEKFPKSKKLIDFSLKILSRTGKVVFESNSIYDRWGGKSESEELPSDVYLWILSYKTTDGKAVDENGEVVILR
jgi:gliding motility-associated-like protein